jgi:hypothetical protein
MRRRSILLAVSLGLASSTAAAETPPRDPIEPPVSLTSATVTTVGFAEPAARGPGPFFVHASFGFNVVTYVAAYGAMPPANASATLTPANYVMLFEQIGFGYWVASHWRVQLTGMLGETLTGLKPNPATGQTPSSLALAAVIPWLVYTDGGFFAGAGPMFAPRAFSHDDFNAGIFTCGGYAVKLGAGLSLAGAVQVPVFLADRVSVAVTPALILGERF